MKFTKNKLIAGAVIFIVLVGSFCWGGGFAKGSSSDQTDKKPSVTASQSVENDDLEKTKTEEVETAETIETAETTETIEKTETMDGDKASEEKSKQQESMEEDVAEKTSTSAVVKVNKVDVAYSEEKGMEIDAETGKDQYLTDPVPEGKPTPVEPENMLVTKKAKTCTLSVVCNTILDNINNLDKEKVELVPEDGIIFPATTVTFYEGESVFNLLHREMKRNKIHMEFVNTPIYNSAYIEGINNLYEFDCGELSGWMYKVNDWFPNYGCSRYQMKQGDVIEWVYTCDLGRDIGGGFDEK